MESKKWLYSALNIEVKPKSSNESTRLMLQLLKSMREKDNLLQKMRTSYAYEEDQKKQSASR